MKLNYDVRECEPFAMQLEGIGLLKSVCDLRWDRVSSLKLEVDDDAAVCKYEYETIGYLINQKSIISQSGVFP